MNKTKLLTAAFATVAFSISSAQASDSSSMEKCRVIDKDGLEENST